MRIVSLRKLFRVGKTHYQGHQDPSPVIEHLFFLDLSSQILFPIPRCTLR